jgi:hypothetical protein
MPQHFEASVTATAAGLDTLASPAIATNTRGREVLMQADSANAQNIIWGDSATQNIVMEPGDKEIVPVERLGEIYVKSVSGTMTLHCAWVV